jgi:hypothetical protein
MIYTLSTNKKEIETVKDTRTIKDHLKFPKEITKFRFWLWLTNPNVTVSILNDGKLDVVFNFPYRKLLEKNEDYNPVGADTRLHKEVINGVISAESGNDLKVLLDLVYSHNWKDDTRRMFLIGLLQGAVMQYNKKASVEELKTIFYK